VILLWPRITSKELSRSSEASSPWTGQNVPQNQKVHYRDQDCSPLVTSCNRRIHFTQLRHSAGKCLTAVWGIPNNRRKSKAVMRWVLLVLHIRRHRVRYRPGDYPECRYHGSLQAARTSVGLLKLTRQLPSIIIIHDLILPLDAKWSKLITSLRQTEGNYNLSTEHTLHDRNLCK
jgi:hypothetical protein